ncbi:NAD-dependent epimerase/dehydratase family protein [Smaragdicoccus niigatensis]|uniref:NAD-dependent epimerase/dehydratase family protein n=1 Tax=Smaragdicoccus niigatensis TaxID=359359 RepID=UPI000372AA78|nr:NAD(P)-dependent oxidoreductase [Smaragdicoccus niigatensis]
MTRIVVTGAAGNLGSRMSAALRGRHELTLIDIAPSDGCHRGDLRESGSWTDLFAGHDVIIHLAGDARPDAGWPEVLTSNVAATMNVYEAAADHNVSRVVLASSVWAARGAWTGGPIPADIAAPGSNAYGASKVFCEQIAKWFWESRGIDSIALRIGGCPPGDARPIRQDPWEDSCWLSPSDAVAALTRATLAPWTGFHVVPVTSANPAGVWDLSRAREILGYVPRDAWNPDRGLVARVVRRIVKPLRSSAPASAR